MPTIIANPTMKSIPLVARRAVVACTEAASANITAKKNRIATAMAPRIVIAFIIMCGVVIPDLNLVLNANCKQKLCQSKRSNLAIFI